MGPDEPLDECATQLGVVVRDSTVSSWATCSSSVPADVQEAAVLGEQVVEVERALLRELRA